MGLDEMGLDEMGINRCIFVFVAVNEYAHGVNSEEQGYDITL